MKKSPVFPVLIVALLCQSMAMAADPLIWIEGESPSVQPTGGMGRHGGIRQNTQVQHLGSGL